MAKKVLIIGGTGFLGKNLVNALLKKGYSVRLLHRKSSNIEGIPADVELVPGDVTDYDSLMKAYKGIDFAFHSAALVKQWVRDRSLFDRINVEGLENSVRAAKANKVKRIVYTSSFMAFGPSNGSPMKETDFRERDKFFNDYERTKYLAELKLPDLVKNGAPIVTVYPGVIYGPGDITEGNIVLKNFILPRIKKAFLGFFLLGKGEGLWSYSYVDDVVDGHILALEKGKIGEGYFLAGENTNHIRLYSLVEKHSGVKPPPLRMPFFAAKMKGALDLTIAKVFGKEPEVTPSAVAIFQWNWAYDSSKAEKELGYKHRSFDEGIKLTIEWLRKDGIIKSK